MYAPDRGNSNFIYLVNQMLGETEEGQMLITGDFNHVQDPH